MNKFLLSYIPILFFHAISFAQISIGFHQVYTSFGERKKDFTEEEIKEIRSTTLVFFYRQTDEKVLPELEKTLKSAWTVTPLIIAPFSQAENYLNKPNYSYASISTLINVGKSWNTWYLLLEFWISKPEEKMPKKNFAWINLSTGSGSPINGSFGDYAYKMGSYYLKGDEMSDIVYKANYGSKLIKEKRRENTDKYFDFLYKEAVLLNWTIPDLKAYFTVINEHILNGTARTFCAEKNDVSEMQRLKKEILLIPSYAFLIPDKSVKDRISYTKTTDDEINKALSIYPYPYEIVDEKELTKEILDSSKTTYYLTHIINNAKTVAIINSKTGRIIYTKCRIIASNQCITEKDIILLKEAINGVEK
ncbi:hypothetical protein QNI16_20270 [Cytophagaceae bacterium YF14B1]|uniref:Uncharacterized protein n=1 Tax=Xanthocytophaga flava TaxID=3048013 RepID=A0AAE3QT05_9BACT|nr:hypothetical protein [Xanthocytophaga flavus]MDJ1482848.1 hypothetical protein [Xanthocytophaga flavus]